MSTSFPMVPLGDVARPTDRRETVVPGKAYRQIGVRLWGEGAYEREVVDGSQTKYKTLTSVESGDIIVNKIWARNGSVAVVSDELSGCYGSNEFPTFSPVPGRLEPKWFHWLTRTRGFWNQCDEQSRGTSGKNRIRPEKFLQILVPLPPLSEQRRIVARIEELVGKVEEARRLRQEAMEETSALMVAGINRATDDVCVDGYLRDVLSVKPRNGWSVRCDGMEDGTAVLSLAAVTGFRYKNTAYKTTSVPTDPNAHYWLHPGDMLMTRSNTLELVGHTAMYDGSPAPCIYPDLMMRLSIDEERADKRFVRYWLMGNTTRTYIRLKAKGTSPSMKKISQGVVMDIPFPSGLKLDRQEAITEDLDMLQSRVDSLRELQSETEKELDAMIPSILDRAFAGKL